MRRVTESPLPDQEAARKTAGWLPFGMTVFT